MSKNILAIDVGGTTIKYALCNEECELSNKGHVNTPDNLEQFYNEIENIYKNAGEVEGIALSMPGAVDSNTGIIHGISFVPYIHGPNIKEDLEKRLNTKIELENDANCAALAEVWKGAAKDYNDSCFVVLGSGVGGAIIKNKKIHHGKNLLGGEFGFQVLGYDKKNKTLVWTNEASTIICVRHIAEVLGVDPKTLNGKDVFDQANSNPVYKKHVDYFYTLCAQGIYNIQYSYDPEVIIIGGAISQRDDIEEELTKRVKKIEDNIDFPLTMPIIKKCHFEGDANLIGAVYHFMTFNKE